MWQNVKDWKERGWNIYVKEITSLQHDVLVVKLAKRFSIKQTNAQSK